MVVRHTARSIPKHFDQRCTQATGREAGHPHVIALSNLLSFLDQNLIDNESRFPMKMRRRKISSRHGNCFLLRSCEEVVENIFCDRQRNGEENVLTVMLEFWRAETSSKERGNSVCPGLMEMHREGSRPTLLNSQRTNEVERRHILEQPKFSPEFQHTAFGCLTLHRVATSERGG